MDCRIAHIWTALSVLLCPAWTFAQGTPLLNGSDLTGWTFHVTGDDEDNAKSAKDAWIVQDGLLINTARCDGYLQHERELKDFILDLEWRSMRLNGNGVAVSGTGSVFLHLSNELGRFGYPKCIEVSLDDGPGGVFFRDVDPFSETKWAFRAPDFADDIEKDLGEWNHLQLICRGDHLTVFVNGTAVNQVDKLTRTRGTVALKSGRNLFQAPMYYRNIRIQPLSDGTTADEKRAATQLATFKAAAEKEQLAAAAERTAEERREKMRTAELDKLWATIDVPQDLEFSADAMTLPFPADAADVEFSPTFGDISLTCPSSLAVLSKFYRTEMARRGWEETEKKREEDSVKVVFRHGDAQVELRLDDDSEGTDVRLDCKGLSFDRASDPAALVAIGVPQPEGYLVLQREFELPKDPVDLDYDNGNRCLFKSTLSLQELFDHLCGQLKAKGYRETRRPIVTDDRRYTEFAKGKLKFGVNIFSHDLGSRAALTCEAH